MLILVFSGGITNVPQHPVFDLRKLVMDYHLSLHTLRYLYVFRSAAICMPGL
jgi:hypothetical protein